MAFNKIKSVYNTQQQQGQYGASGNMPNGNPYMSNTGLQVQRGCGRYPGVYNVGDEDCQIVTLPGTSTRATVCNCRSDLCNSRRPDQVTNPLTGQNNAIGTNTGFYPNAGSSNTYSNYNYNQQQQPGYIPNQQNNVYGTNSPYGGQSGYNQYPNSQNGYQSGYYGTGNQQYPNTAYGPQSNPGTYGSNYPQGNQYGGQNSQYGGVSGTVNTPYNTQYGYDGRYGAASANWISPWTLSFSLVMLYLFAKL